MVQVLMRIFLGLLARNKWLTNKGYYTNKMSRPIASARYFYV